MDEDKLKILLKNFANKVILQSELSNTYLEVKPRLGGDSPYTAYLDAKQSIFFSYEIDKELKLFDTICDFYNHDYFMMNRPIFLDSFCKKILYELRLNINKTNTRPTEVEILKIIDEESTKFIEHLNNIPKEINFYLYPNNLNITTDVEGELYKDLEIIQLPRLDLSLGIGRRPYKLKYKVQMDVFDEYRNNWRIFNTILCLFDLGNIYLQEISNDLEAYLNYFEFTVGKEFPLLNSPCIPPGLVGLTRFTYKVDNSNFDNIKEFFNLFVPIFRKMDREHFVSIATNFYKTSLDKFNPAEQITYATIALESLYNTDSNDIKKTLIFRCSKILSYYYDENIIEKIKKDISDAYNCRSHYVHGKGHHKDAKNELATNILNYARLSIIIFLQLNNMNKISSNKTKAKENIIAYIDKALTHRKFDEELSEKLNSCLLFNESIF